MKVQSAFEKNFQDHDEIGAAITVYHKGTKVVDLWAGYKDKNTFSLWEEDTIVPVFSVTKGLTSLCFLILATQKKINYDEKVALYWPEFASKGKENITIRELLEHRAGLHVLDCNLLIEDFWNNPDKVYNALISQKPKWIQTDRQAYGAQVWGAYAAELFKQITGETAGNFFNREISKKLKLNVFLGLPSVYQSRVATVYPVSSIDRIRSLIPHFFNRNDSEGRTVRAILTGDTNTTRAYLNPWIGFRGLHAFNDPDLQTSELLWANGMADARSLAYLYNIFVTNGKNLKIKIATKKILDELTSPRVLKYDEVIHKNLAWSLGFMKEETGVFSPNPESFGHPGMGGSLGFVDTKAKISIGYVCNKMDYRNRPLKTLALCKAVYESI
ncbi:serine hydrolase domain-containing protein [Leptospira sp. GIMC2001]|uniref:serine hydrolase domain-containing protein n=1 Tax=Leptospira sp. GIMC2001 TaxID=1513297 RepID=UPI00234A3FED|nr:serine hydrolase domain-containing protein [Leptospira sp. GIMC2001]WCL50897.1 serine hydrolase [Leptospira sp. GIMC2001]